MSSPQLQIDIAKFNVIGVQNYGSSGSLFFHSLLDEHPEVFALPALYGMSFYHFWDNHREGEPMQLMADYINSLDFWFHPFSAIRSWGCHTMGENKDQKIFVDREKFLGYVKAIFANLPEQNPRKKLFICIYIAYELCLGRDLSKKRFLLYPVHSVPKSQVELLVEDFPETKFLHMIRNPVNLYGSIIKNHLSSHDDRHVELCLSSLHLLFLNSLPPEAIKTSNYAERPYFPERRENYRALRLEDIHEKGPEALRPFCEWLGISWHDCLNHSTFNGLKWWNMPTHIQVSGFDTQIIKQDYKDLASPFDKARVKFLAQKKLHKWNYPTHTPQKQNWFSKLFPLWVWLPFRFEWKNRGVRRRVMSHTLEKATTLTEDMRAWLRREIRIEDNQLDYGEKVLQYKDLKELAGRRCMISLIIEKEDDSPLIEIMNVGAEDEGPDIVNTVYKDPKVQNLRMPIWQLNRLHLIMFWHKWKIFFDDYRKIRKALFKIREVIDQEGDVEVDLL